MPEDSLATDLAFRLLHSTDLQNWSTVPSADITVDSDAESGQSVWSYLIPDMSGSQLFQWQPYFGDQ